MAALLERGKKACPSAYNAGTLNTEQWKQEETYIHTQTGMINRMHHGLTKNDSKSEMVTKSFIFLELKCISKNILEPMKLHQLALNMVEPRPHPTEVTTS